MFCSISHSVFVYDKGYTYNRDVTFKDSTLNNFKELLNKLLNENPENFFDRVKFAMRDGSVTLIPLGDLGFKIILEFKRHPNRYLTNTGELEIKVVYLGSPPAVKSYVYATVSNLCPSEWVLPMERAFSVIPSAAIVVSGFYLLFSALELGLVLV